MVDLVDYHIKEEFNMDKDKDNVRKVNFTASEEVKTEPIPNMLWEDVDVTGNRIEYYRRCKTLLYFYYTIKGSNVRKVKRR